MLNLTLDDAEEIHDLQNEFAAAEKGSLKAGEHTVIKYIFRRAGAGLAPKLVTQEGEPSVQVAKRALQAVTTTKVLVAPLRPSTPEVRRIRHNIAATQFARNFVTGTWMTLCRWNRLADEAKEDFLAHYRRTTTDDPFEERVAEVAKAAVLAEHLRANPHEAQLADLEREWEEALDDYRRKVAEHEERGGAGKPPRRPSKLQRRIRDLRKKAARWKAPSDCTRTLERFVRLHDQMQMLSRWTGSKTGPRPKKPRTYEYRPLDLVHPEGVGTFGWGAFLCCVRAPENIDAVLRTGEPLDHLDGAYSYCVRSGVQAFVQGLKAYNAYWKAVREGKSPGRKVGRPRLKRGTDTISIQQCVLYLGGSEPEREGLSERGGWEVEMREGEDYFPFIRVGGIGDLRIPKKHYRRVRAALAHGGKISDVSIREVADRHLGPGELPPRRRKRTRGKRKRAARRDGSPKTRYLASIAVTNIPVPLQRGEFDPSRVLGLDPGSRKFLTTSDGRMFEDLRVALRALIKKEERARRRTSRWNDPRCPDRLRGKGYLRAQEILARACADTKKMRRHLHEQVIDELLALPYDYFAIEDTAGANLTRSAKGTADLPGRNVSAGRSRTRGWLAQGHYQFRTRLIQRCKAAGKVVVLVPAPYTSQTCSRCGSINDVGSSETYRCSSCGLVIDRDHNGANNMRDRGIEFLEEAGLPVVGGEWSARTVPRG